MTESATRSIETPADTPDPLKADDSSAFLTHFVVLADDSNRRRGDRFDVAVVRSEHPFVQSSLFAVILSGKLFFYGPLSEDEFIERVVYTIGKW